MYDADTCRPFSSLVLQPHLHGQVADELLELVAARHKVRLAVHLHQHAQPAAHASTSALHNPCCWEAAA
jgi:hypothetical protein